MTKKKIVVAVVLVVLLGIALLGYALYQARVTTGPDMVAIRFYNSWVEAVNAGDTARQQDLYTSSTYITRDFGREIASGQEREKDYVLCGIPGPSSFEVEQVQVTEESDMAAVIGLYGGKVFRVIMVRDGGMWRIDEIDCPKVQRTVDEAQDGQAEDVPVPAQSE